MAIKLHRCAHVWLKLGPCWRVHRALDEAAIDYELVKGRNRPSKRDDLERLSGQRFYPVIEFEDGRVFRAESKDMAARIRAGPTTRGGSSPPEARRKPTAEHGVVEAEVRPASGLCALRSGRSPSGGARWQIHHEADLVSCADAR